jgi:glycosyltransferase involved in cell wall biosynthesis
MLSVSLVTLGSPGQLTGGYLFHRRLRARASDNDARLDFVPLPSWPFPLPALAGGAARRRADRADVVVLDSIAAGFLAPWPLPRPLAAMAHQPPGGIDHGEPRRSIQARLDRAVYARCDLVMLASAALGPDFSGLRTEVVPPGRDLVPPAEGPVADLGSGDRVALLSVGNWVERKGTLELLEALVLLPPGLAVLHLVGRTDVDPSYTARVEAKLARPDLDGRVVVHGPLDHRDVARMYRSAHVFVLASRREPYGTVYGEAMAAGLPVVGWAAGNLPNLADDGREGLVVAPGDVTALAAALERLASDHDLRRTMAEAARARAQQLPTWDETAARFFALLRGLVDGDAFNGE